MTFAFTKKRVFLFSSLFLVLLFGVVAFGYIKTHKEAFIAGTFSTFSSIAQLLPIEPDTKKEIEVIDTLVSDLTKQDDVVRTYLVLLQNNFELRPGGGFLGQYAVLSLKNGGVVSFKIEDANLLDQRITAKVSPPWPLRQYAQIKNWKFRDSNFSPDFPTNAEKAQYFYRLGGGWEKFDGVISVNADALDRVLGITGPIDISGFGTYTENGAALKLEEQVEKAYLGDNVPAELKQNRKNVMKLLGKEIINRLATPGNISKVSSLVLAELRDKTVQLSFKDATLQQAVENVHWDGRVEKHWDKDYLFIVDANLGALKTDYYIKRSLNYVVDFTGEKPTATTTYFYNHTAPAGDWRTSDYHTYTRIYAPLGAKYIEESRKNTGGVTSQDSEEFSKTVFGYKVDALIGQTLETSIRYELPTTITAENYELLIQKQSGVGTLPVKITLKTNDGEIVREAELKKDLRLTFSKE